MYFSYFFQANEANKKKFILNIIVSSKNMQTKEKLLKIYYNNYNCNNYKNYY